MGLIVALRATHAVTRREFTYFPFLFLSSSTSSWSIFRLTVTLFLIRSSNPSINTSTPSNVVLDAFNLQSENDFEPEI